MHLISYVSSYVDTSKDMNDILNDIIKISKRNNAEMNVTGILFLMDGKFLQILEGEERIVRSLANKIKLDERHINFEILIDSSVAQRGFDDWNMNVMHLKAGKQYSRHYIKSITNAFENMTVLKSDKLVEFYRALLEEKKTARFCLWSYLQSIFTNKRPAC